MFYEYRTYLRSLSLASDVRIMNDQCRAPDGNPSLVVN